MTDDDRAASGRGRLGSGANVTSGPGQGPEVSDQAEVPVAPAPRKRARGIPFKFLIPAVLVLDVLAVIFVPPFPAGGQAGDACSFPQCFIESAIEYPPPAVVIDLAPSADSGTTPMIYFHPSISSTLLTMWIVIALLLLFGFLATRGLRTVPGRLQNAIEWAFEFGRDFAVGIGGERARRYYPIFAAFFVLILFSNWSGLVPPIGKIEWLRAPTSDVNITIGLALVSFAIIQGEGFHRLGVRGYLGKYFPLGEFRHGIGAGILAMYVGVIEAFLELVKAVTLSMRLFGNIYGGEVALAVITALTIAIVPIALVGLEALLNLIQALIFSVLTLMFILIAIEGHGSDEHRAAEGGASADHGAPQGADNNQPAAA
jgi:F-type H+-transporting ATPase subunit a